MTSERPVSRICSGRKPAQNASRIIHGMRGFSCDESSQVCVSSDVPCSFEPDSRPASAEGCLCHAVFRETREELSRAQIGFEILHDEDLWLSVGAELAAR